MNWFWWKWNRGKEELSAELEAHLRLDVEARMARGMNPKEARQAALRELGNIPLIQDVAREKRGGMILEHITQDARYAFRQLRRSPGFAVTVFLTLALGIGANLAVFQLLYSAILAKLPVRHPEELVSVHAAKSPFDQSWTISYLAYQRLRASTGGRVPLLARSAYGGAILQISSQNRLEARYELVSDNYFQVLGTLPAVGRFFVQTDSSLGQSEWPAVVRYGFAKQHFGGSQQALGKHILLNGVSSVIIGVANERFLGVLPGYVPDFWLPLEAQSSGRLEVPFDSLGPGHNVNLEKPWGNQASIFWLFLMARVPEKQRQEVAGRWSAVFQADRALMASATTDPAAKAAVLGGTVQMVSAEQGMGWLGRYYLSPLTLLMGLSISVFLVGCLNLASLQLARLSARAQELSVRTALGASRWRLLRQVMIEDAILVVLGGAGSFLIGRAASSALLRWASSRGFPLTFNLDLNLPIAALGFGLMVAAWIAFSILPVLSFMRTGLQYVAGLKSKVAGLAQTRQQRWRSNAMLVSEVGLSLLLVTMAGCFAATLRHWEQLDVGMDREHILSVSLAMRRSGYLDQQRDLPQLYHRIRERLESAPGIRSAAVEMCPLTQCGWVTALYAFGHNGFSEGQLRGEEDHVGSGFFATMGIPLLRGRDFSERDTTETQRVAILSQRYARQLFGEEDPVGHWVGYEPAPHDHKFLIVGVVADARVDGVRGEAPPMVYMSVDQDSSLIQRIQIRAVGDPAKLAAQVRDLLRQVDADLPITEITPLADELSGGLGTEKLLTRLAGLYAALALLLVGIGLYGVLSFRTSRRQGEFGVRLALGATRGHIHWLVIGQIARILLAGIGAGLCLSSVAIHLARHLLYASQTANALAACAAVVVLVATGVGAALLPARRAALADPLETLRQE